MDKQQAIIRMDMVRNWQYRRGLDNTSDIVIATTSRNATFYSTFEKAAREGRKMYLHFNEGDIRPGSKRLTIADIRIVKNFLLDAESSKFPTLAWEVGKLTYSFLGSEGFCEKGQDLDITGAGFHLPLGVPNIYCRNAQEANEINEGWKYVVRYIIRPLFDKACKQVGVVMDLDVCDIAKLCSFPGTLRFPKPEKGEIGKDIPPELREPFLRHSILSDGERHTYEALKAAVLNHGKYNPPKRTRDYKKDQVQPVIVESTIFDFDSRCDNAKKYYFENKVRETVEKRVGRISKSDEFCTVLFHLAGSYGQKVALNYAEYVNGLVGMPFKQEDAVYYAQKALLAFVVPKYHQDFTLVLKPDTKIDITDEEKSVLIAWSESEVRKQEGSRISVRQAHETYCLFCSSYDVEPVSIRQFGRFMQLCDVDTGAMYIGQQKARCYMNLAFNIRKVERQLIEIAEAV